MLSDGIENEVRRVVARHLGVSKRWLRPDVSLGDDLGSDRAGIESLVLAVESRLGVRMQERVLDEVRSYGDLVEATVAAIRKQRAQLRRAGDEAPAGRVRVAGPNGFIVERSDRLTPYVLETVYDDAWRAGRGATVTITVDVTTTDEQIAELRTRLAALGRRGVSVLVARSETPARRMQ